MDTTQRVQLFKSSLEKAIQKWEQVVVFDNPASGKFVQFAVQTGEELMWVDVPVQELNQEQYNWLLPHMKPIHSSDGELLSLQKEVNTRNTQYAADYTEWIFTKIFRLPENYDVDFSIFT